MRQQLLANGYNEQGEADGLFNTIWSKQVGPLLLIWHDVPEVYKIDVYIVKGYNIPFVTMTFINRNFWQSVQEIENAILEMYKTLHGALPGEE